MLSSITAVGVSATAGIWHVLVFFGVIASVTLVALCRAKREDIPRIFESFAAAFGFRKFEEPGSATGTPQLNGRESPQRKQVAGADEPEEIA